MTSNENDLPPYRRPRFVGMVEARLERPSFGREKAVFFLLLLALGLSACRGDEVEEAAVLPTSTPVPEATQPPPTPQPPTPTATAALPTATATETATLEPAVTAEPTTAAAEVVIRGQVTVHGDMNVRAGPGTEYPIVGGATLGQEFDVTGKNADGSWWQIDLEGQPGWIFAPYVTAVDTENVPVVAAGEMEMMEKRAFVTVNGDMNVRNGPGTNYAVIGPATYGQEYDITGQSEDGEWWRIEYIGQTGWIFAPFVEAAGAENVATVGSVEFPAQGGAVVTVNGEMNVRQGPGTTYEIVGAATLGQEFPVTGKNADGDWWQIDFNGQAGWLFAPFVTAANTENVPVAGGGEMAAPEGAQATVDSDLNVRAGPGTEYGRIGGANAGEQFQITGKDETGEWFRLDFDGQNGWVFALYVTATSAADVPVVAAEPAAPAAPAAPVQEDPPGNPTGDQAVITHVVDGDTLDLLFEDGTQERILLQDIDAPEAEGVVECFGGQASLFASLFKGETVRVERTGRDELGRLLGYVWLANGRLLNESLARQGYAKYDDSGTPGSYAARILAAAEEAQGQGAGLWSECPVEAAPTATPTPAG